MLTKRTFCPRSLQVMKHGYIILMLKILKKGIQWSVIIYNHHNIINSRQLLQPGRPWSLVFWDNYGVNLLDVMPKWETISSQANINTLTKLNPRFSRVRPHMKTAELHLLHDNTRSRISLATREEIIKLDWIVLPQSPYRHDVAPLPRNDFHPFRQLKDTPCNKFENDEGVIWFKQWENGYEIKKLKRKLISCITFWPPLALG